MFLKKIKLENFKCLEDVELSFESNKLGNRHWTLVLGENGTGKSNLLKSIALILAGSDALGELVGQADNWIRFGQNNCKIEADLETKDGKERHISLIINRKDTLSKIISNNRDTLQLIDEALEYTDRNYFIVGYGANRRLSNDLFGRSDKSGNNRLNSIKNLFDNNVPLNPLTSWVIDLDYRSGDGGLTVVKETLNDFLPETHFHGIDKEKKQILFQTIDGIVPLEQLSDGYQNMAAWIGDLLYRITETFRDYKHPLEVRGVLLIDEIDSHLHPKWQRKLINFIQQKLPNLQVIATTHSPLTAQQVNEGELFALKRDENGKINIIPFIGSPKSLLVNQLLMTPVFGLESDESYEVENAKKTYRALESKSSILNADDKEKMKTAKATLKSKMPRRDMPTISSQEIALLAKIEKQLNIK
jgi:predicted ATP-binding protein involved in virulence